jgi:hypothetical protein
LTAAGAASQSSSLRGASPHNTLHSRRVTPRARAQANIGQRVKEAQEQRPVVTSCRPPLHLGGSLALKDVALLWSMVGQTSEPTAHLVVLLVRNGAFAGFEVRTSAGRSAVHASVA